MFLTVLSVLIPMVSTVCFIYDHYAGFYQGSEELLIVLCIFGTLCSLVMTLPLNRYMRILCFFVPYMAVTVITYNFVAATAIILLSVIIGLIPKALKSGKIIFTESGAPIILRYRKKCPFKLHYLRFAASFILSVILLFACTYIFDFHTPLWRIRAFPVDLTTQKELIADEVIPSGQVTCTVIYDSPVMKVEDFYTVETYDGKLVSPAVNAGLKPGDVITHINHQNAIESDFLNGKCDGEDIVLTVVRIADSKAAVLDITLSPAYSPAEDKYFIGITYYKAYPQSGITTVQTLSFVDPTTGYFGATAHASEDLPALGADPVFVLKTADVKGRDKQGLMALPGEDIGKSLYSSGYGSFGITTLTDGESIPIAEKGELKLGKAKLLSSFSSGSVEEFDVYIIGTYRIASRDVMCVLITDERLLDEGGITKGMSGSPIIQNGKLIGALSNTDLSGRVSYATFVYDMAHELYCNTDKLKE